MWWQAYFESLDFAGWFNVAEAGLWFTLAGVVRWRGGPGSLVLALLVFGCTDGIEAQTGAWWRPWWLLVAKVACAACIAHGLWRWLRRAGGRLPAQTDSKPS